MPLVERPGFDYRQGEAFGLRHRVQTGTGIHPDSYSTSTGGCFPGGLRRPGHEADH